MVLPRLVPRLVGSLLVLLSLLKAVASDRQAQSDKSLNVTVLSDPPISNNTLCTNEAVVLTCLVSNAIQPTYKWSSSVFNISDQDRSIKVIATVNSLEYYCSVNDVATNRSGQGSISVVGKSSPPIFHRLNFNEVIEVDERKSVNLTVEIVSSVPLTAQPVWSRLDEPLPSKAVVTVYDLGFKTFSSLSIAHLSFANDSGNYSLTAGNKCGESSLFAYIDVKGPHVCPSVDPVPVLLHGCVDSAAIDGDILTYKCSYEADYDEFERNALSHWTIKELSHGFILVNETSTYAEYTVTVYRDCLLGSEFTELCCRVTSELTIRPTSLIWNNATVSCFAGLSDRKGKVTSSSAHLTVLVKPKLIARPTNVTVNENGNASLICQFSASTLDHITSTEWQKDERIIINSNRYHTTTILNPQERNEVYSVLNITNVTKVDAGSYRCYCFYNNTTLNALHINTHITAQGLVILRLQDIEQRHVNYDKIEKVVGIAIGATVVYMVIFSFLWNIRRQYAKVNDTKESTETDHSQTSNSDSRSMPSTVDNAVMKAALPDKTVIKEVTIRRAKSLPGDTDVDYEIELFDERGGVFHSSKHGVTVVFPAGAVPIGVLAELKFKAMLVAPIKISPSAVCISAVYWLCMDVDLQMPIEIHLPHTAKIENEDQVNALRFVKFQHWKSGKEMNIVEGGKFRVGESYGSIVTNHFCYYCIEIDKLDCSCIPRNKYVVVAAKMKLAKSLIWEGRICLCPRLPTCTERLKEQYVDDKDNEWSTDVLSPFSLAQGCDKVQVIIEGDNWPTHATIAVLNDDKIQQREIDFHHCYNDEEAKADLKFNMDNCLYPPRVKFAVHSTNWQFFQRPNTVGFKLNGAVKLDDDVLAPLKMIIPATETTVSSSDSASMSFSSRNTDHIDNTSIEALLARDTITEGKLRDVLIASVPVASRWFELGCALGVSIPELSKLYDKYSHKPVKALIRMYHHWLVDGNNAHPTSERVIEALRKINEHSLAAAMLISLNPQQSASNQGEPDDPEKNLVLKKMRDQIELLNFTELVPLLNGYQLLTQNENYTLLNDKLTPKERGNALLYTILGSKGPGAYGLFIRCISEETSHAGHRHLATLLR